VGQLTYLMSVPDGGSAFSSTQAGSAKPQPSGEDLCTGRPDSATEQKHFKSGCIILLRKFYGTPRGKLNTSLCRMKILGWTLMHKGYKENYSRKDVYVDKEAMLSIR